MSYNFLSNDIEISNFSHSQVYKDLFETLTELVALLAYKFFWGSKSC
jgi:hypothetical protein